MHSDKVASEPALRNGWAHLRLWSVAGVGLAADLLSKAWSQQALTGAQGQSQPIVMIEGYLTFTLRYNAGAAFSMAEGRTGLLILAAAVAVGLLFWFFAGTRANQRWSHGAVGLLLAGALGNLYDRVFNEGQVVDFIEVNLHFWPANPWPTFNVADVLLCVGVGILLLNLRSRRGHSAAFAAFI